MIVRTGGWLSRDPIGEKGGLNLYGFDGNDGVKRWDLLGLKLKEHKAGTATVDYLKGVLPGNRAGATIAFWTNPAQTQIIAVDMAPPKEGSDGM
jgi:uncharacterized protein RhaS with RHS repeats